MQQITKTHLGDVTLTVSTVVHEGPVGGDAREFIVEAKDGKGEVFKTNSYPKLSLAFAEVHRFTMAEYAGSAYVVDCEDDDAFRPYL